MTIQAYLTAAAVNLKRLAAFVGPFARIGAAGAPLVPIEES
ncbi:hypothetical protein [Mesorhizobium sp. M0910]